MNSHTNVQSIQPHDLQGSDPVHHQQSASHEEMQSQHRTTHPNNLPQVQSLNMLSSQNTPSHLVGTDTHDTPTLPLPKQNKTTWTNVQYKKRPRDTTGNDKAATKQPKLNNYWLNQPPLTNENKYAILMEEGSEETQSKTQQIAPRAPPIYVAGVQNIHPLKELLLKIAGDDFELKVLQGNQVKIQPKPSKKYSTIIKALAEKHTEFHTYQPKENRNF